MKQWLKFHLIGLLFVLCNTTVMGAYSSIQRQDKEPDFSYISQKQVNQKAVDYLYYIYSHTPKEILATADLQFPHQKNNTRLLLQANNLRNSLQTTFLSDNHTHTYFHPDPVEYYIFALKKIVI